MIKRIIKKMSGQYKKGTQCLDKLGNGTLAQMNKKANGQRRNKLTKIFLSIALGLETDSHKTTGLNLDSVAA